MTSRQSYLKNYPRTGVKVALAMLLLVGVPACGGNDEPPAMDHSEHDHEAMLAEQAARMGQPEEGGMADMDHSEHDHEAMMAAQSGAMDQSDHDMANADADAGMMDHSEHDHEAMMAQAAAADQSARTAPSGDGSATVVEVDPSVIKTIGVRTTTVEVRPLSREIRSTGRFEMDESGAHTVTVRTPGWVEKLHVNYEGALVQKGQPLLDLYSPDLVATQEEYLLAFRNAERMAASRVPGMAEDAKRLLEAARRRLLLWDLSEQQIAELEATGTPRRTIQFNVPVTGEVMRKSVSEGQHVNAGQPLLEIYDLSKIWLIADIYEQDLVWVSEGLPVRVELPYDPGKTFNGRIDHIYYMLDPATRTARARIILPGQRQTFKPGMYATVYVQSKPLSPSPVVPEEAVIRTGDQDVVIVDLGDGRYAPTAVHVGVLAEGSYQILHGLSGGERVVTRAQFLIDSEARLKSAVGAMAGHQH